MTTKHTRYSQRKEIRWNPIDKSATGHYYCRVRPINGYDYVSKSWELKVLESTLPAIEATNIEYGQSQKYRLDDYANLICKYSGIPKPKIKWMKDDEEIIPVENDTHISLLQDNSILSIHLNAGDEGTYRCVAKNPAGEVFHEMTVDIESKIDLNHIFFDCRRKINDFFFCISF